jgi:ribonuclease E
MSRRIAALPSTPQKQAARGQASRRSAGDVMSPARLAPPQRAGHMTGNRMLIDASHPEETRVVVQRGNRIEEFDFESASRRQLRGNIYLAKVTRVEPSLQAAFVEYGGNRHGFLAFSEIHPDYYQIPMADREALLAEEAAHEAEDDEDDAPAAASEASGEAVAEDADSGGDDGESGGVAQVDSEPEVIEQIGGGGDAMEEARPRRTFRPRRQYKIQEVIKRRQILLVQVVKEERGGKGAALTTYLSLAGRYSVLMPNTARGGGISRKITNSADRKRLKELVGDLEVPDGMGVILRTAGAMRTKPEIKRDFEYLLRVWETVRETTLQSVAPTLVYEEGSLIKRAIRDLYSKEIEEITVAGEGGYNEAREFMKMLMPAQAKSIRLYRDPQPLFARHGVEHQLDQLFTSTVTLKSGGYIVINPTEALVSIDVNSGRSTREHNIEDTALRTNLEAAEEVARQLRLRDLAGLIVIDFIDMEEKRNNRAVEKKLKDCLKNDRARIQVGRISHFGLMEMSRQRIRTGVLESSTSPCPHCAGSGFVRATPSVALHILRGVEEQLLRNASYHLTVRTRTEAALYVLNQKRSHLSELERRFGVTITVLADDSLTGANHFALERGEPAPGGGFRAESMPPAPVEVEEDAAVDEAEEMAEADDAGTEVSGERGERAARDDAEDGEGRRRRKRRRRRGRDRDDREPRADRPETTSEAGAESGEDSDSDSDGEGEGHEAGEENARPGDGENGERRRRRRGRRGGRRQRRDEDGAPVAPDGVAATDGGLHDAEPEADAAAALPEAGQPEPATPAEDPAPVKKPRTRRKAAAAAETGSPPVAESAPAAEENPPAKKPRARRKAAAAPAPVAEEAAPDAVQAVDPQPAPVPAPEPAPVSAPAAEPEEVEDPNRPKRTGWWARAKKAIGG